MESLAVLGSRSSTAGRGQPLNPANFRPYKAPPACGKLPEQQNKAMPYHLQQHYREAARRRQQAHDQASFLRWLAIYGALILAALTAAVM
jgi:hypothetical protein